MVTKEQEKNWYVIHTRSGYENRVKTNLKQRIKSMGVEDEILRVVVPTEEEVEVRSGQRRTITKKTFPGYVIVEMKLTDSSRKVVRETPGVTGFVGNKNNPVPLEAEEVESILTRMESGTPHVKVGFGKGDGVRVVDGPFTDFTGVVDEIHPERGRVKIRVSFFGRETPLELDFLQVSRL
ncbi:MAG: transcription termination/antitermination factor NusG [Dehalococcoidia bacterium]|nr:transcription termination/antitermination factor NusG [Dehalococcoidia bacterium]